MTGLFDRTDLLSRRSEIHLTLEESKVKVKIYCCNHLLEHCSVLHTIKILPPQKTDVKSYFTKIHKKSIKKLEIINKMIECTEKNTIIGAHCVDLEC